MSASSSSVQVVNTDAKSRLATAPAKSGTVYLPQQNLPDFTTAPDNASQEEQLHIIDQPWTLSNWHKHLNWLHVVILVGVPFLGLYGWMTTEIQSKTLVWAVLYYFMTGLGITAGVFPSSDIY
jgi:stearoyl-CoA desaturase (delta-9 desaturase)